MDRDYQREHDTAKEAADYAETIPGWTRMEVVRDENGKYWLKLEWDESDGEKAKKG